MMISTKGRYALRVMLDLAQQEEDGYISLKSISGRQGISVKYMEMIVSILNKAGYVKSLSGKEGGYRLSRPANQYTVGSILKLTDGSLAPVSYLEHCGDSECGRSGACLTLPMWKKLERLIDSYLEGVTLQDLLDGKV